MTVLAGGVVVTLAVTGNVGTPLSFLLLGAALGLFVVGYAAMTRYVDNAGAFSSYIAQGLNGAWGVASSAVACVAYNTIQIGLYGLFGAMTAMFAEAHFGLTWHWWVWALLMWVVIALLGVLNIDLSAKVLGVLLIAEVAAVLLFDIGAFGHPAGDTVSSPVCRPANSSTTASAGCSRSASPRSSASSPRPCTPRRPATRSAPSPGRPTSAWRSPRCSTRCRPGR